jgi:hypothetical protein
MCDHKFVHLDTIKKHDTSGYNTQFIRIDRFFCEKCLEQKEVRKSEYAYSRETPEWY